MKRFLSLAFFLSIFLAACGVSSVPATAPVIEKATTTLTVFAASSLTDAFTEVGAAFDAANPDVTTTFNFAGSQSLRTQIEEGAPADVFASASIKEMDTLVTGSFVTKDAPQIFLTNKLVVILPAENPAMIEKLEDLATPGIKIVLAAEEVPAGKYARQAIDQMDASFRAGYKDKFFANVVSNENNVKQVVGKVQLGEADAGIVYVSDVVAVPELKSIEIPEDLNIIAEYPIAPLIKSQNAELAAKFIQFTLSPEGQAILAKWGFILVQ